VAAVWLLNGRKEIAMKKKKFQVLKVGHKVTELRSDQEMKQVNGGQARPSELGCGGPGECIALHF
jgi:hypothetical protein